MATHQTRHGRSVIAKETVAIIEAGEYALGPRTVAIRELQDKAVVGSRIFDVDDIACVPTRRDQPTRFEVTDETTLGAAQRLHSSPAAGEGTIIGILNFASAKARGSLVTRPCCRPLLIDSPEPGRRIPQWIHGPGGVHRPRLQLVQV